MFFSEPDDSRAQVTSRAALRHLVLFQIKLGADALRDLLLSPVSVLVFLHDIIRKPSVEDSLYLRLMVLGRRSDRYINLFDEHKDKGHYTVDEAIETVADMVLEKSAGTSNARRESGDR